MKTQSPAPIQVNMKGPIGESTPLFTLPIAGAREIVLDMTDVTYINSIGVKHWIIWTGRIPRDCVVRIVNAPLVIVSQANTVVGFLTPHMRFDSFRLPYACEQCSFEETRIVRRGVEYDYPNPPEPRKLNVPNPVACPKCGKETLEPDVFLEKTFAFLK